MLPVAMPMMRSWTNFVMGAVEECARESNEWLVERQQQLESRTTIVSGPRRLARASIGRLEEARERRYAGVSVTGIPFRTVVPEGSIHDLLVREQVRVDPGLPGGHVQLGAGGVVAPAVRHRDDPRHEIVARLDRDRDRADPRGEDRGVAVLEPEARDIGVVESRRAPSLAAGERGQVVHPRVERSLLAPPDEQHVRQLGVDEGGEPLALAEEEGMAELDSPARSAEDAGQPRLERAEVDPVRRFLEDAEGEPSRPGAEGVPVGAAAEVDVEEPLLPGARLERGEQLVRIPARDRGVRIGAAPAERVECDLPVERLEVGSRAEATDDRGESEHDLPLVACVGGQRQHRRRVVGDVPHRGRVDGQVVVRALERGRRRQDHVRPVWSSR